MAGINRSVTDRVSGLLSDSTARRISLLAIATLVLTGLWHENHWHLVSAVMLAAVPLILLFARRLGRALTLPRVRIKADGPLGIACVVVAVTGLFLPFATMTARGAPFWDGLTLAGSLTLLWLTLREYMWDWRRALTTMLWVGGLWAGVLLASPTLAALPAWAVTATFAAVIGVTLMTIFADVSGARRVAHRWVTVAGSLMLVVAQPIEHLIESL